MITSITRQLQLTVSALLVTYIFLMPLPSRAHDGEPVGAIGDVIPVSALGRAAIGLQMTSVERKSRPMVIRVPGKIEVLPNRQFEQHAPLSGRISKVSVFPGDAVRQGQELAVVDSLEMNQLAAQLLQSKLDTESEYARQKTALDEEVRQAEARSILAEANYKRFVRLMEERIAAQKDVLQAQNELDLSETRLKTAEQSRQINLKALREKINLVQQPLRQRLVMLGLDESRVEDMLKRQTTLTSVPVLSARGGTVVAIHASAGQSIDPSVNLFTIADLGRVWATANVYEDDMSRMRLGEPVDVHVHALSGQAVSGRLTFIGQQVDAVTRTLPVRAELDNPGLRLKPDMFAELCIETSDSTPVITVPHDAVIEKTGHRLVFKEVKGGFQASYVKVGRTFGDQIEILEGVLPGDRIVARGAFQLAAELLKSQEGEAPFASPTEGEHGGEAERGPRDGTISLNLQTGLVVVTAAFLLGLSLSAVFMARGKGVHLSLHDLKEHEVVPDGSTTAFRAESGSRSSDPGAVSKSKPLD